MGTTEGGVRLTLDIWHPDCWGIQATEATDAGLLVHREHRTTDETVKSHCTVFGESNEQVDAFIEHVDASQLTHVVTEAESRRGSSHVWGAPGNTSRELFVEFEPCYSIGDALVTAGFINEAPVRVVDGEEHWPVFVEDDRAGITERLDRVGERLDADISVRRITESDQLGGTVSNRRQRLTTRQREVFDLACERNYYAWPREVTTRELAEELDISKTTMLEHLRKAEAKLLARDD
ncbi:helix-turn-helix domain-containing protein [Halospeciosus flavus]|uniref:Helix-turn-helix domain-containing protein n=1 Tax=Halospeciosus flavus TaxID=3032283 RepID=A0ABD5Z7N8_9EURY|nr:helix-turn-helix domain-containing protein [Halospeciosus flavus]